MIKLAWGGERLVVSIPIDIHHMTMRILVGGVASPLQQGFPRLPRRGLAVWRMFISSAYPVSRSRAIARRPVFFGLRQVVDGVVRRRVPREALEE